MSDKKWLQVLARNRKELIREDEVVIISQEQVEGTWYVAAVKRDTPAVGYLSATFSPPVGDERSPPEELLCSSFGATEVKYAEERYWFDGRGQKVLSCIYQGKVVAGEEYLLN